MLKENSIFPRSFVEILTLSLKGNRLHNVKTNGPLNVGASLDVGPGSNLLKSNGPKIGERNGPSIVNGTLGL